MKTIIQIILLLILNSSLCFSQENSSDKIKLNELIVEFEQSIVEKDSTRFMQIFFDDQVPFVGIMSEETEMSIKKDYPDFEGIAVSNCKNFITDICKASKKQVEKFYDIKIDTDGSIGSVSFDYSFISGTKMIQWGNEKWNLVKTNNEWLITDVIYSIHFPDIEQFPYSQEEPEEKD